MTSEPPSVFKKNSKENKYVEWYRDRLVIIVVEE